jgi:acyl carrier protein
MEDVIRDYIGRELVGKPELLPIQNDTPLIESGIFDSLAMLKLVLFLEERFGVTVAVEEVVPDNFATVNAISAFLRTQRQDQESPG